MAAAAAATDTRATPFLLLCVLRRVDALVRAWSYERAVVRSSAEERERAGGERSGGCAAAEPTRPASMYTALGQMYICTRGAMYAVWMYIRGGAPQKADVPGIDEARGAPLPRSPYLARSTPNAADTAREERSGAEMREMLRGPRVGLYGARPREYPLSFCELIAPPYASATSHPPPFSFSASLDLSINLLSSLCAAPRIPTILIPPYTASTTTTTTTTTAPYSGSSSTSRPSTSRRHANFASTGDLSKKFVRQEIYTINLVSFSSFSLRRRTRRLSSR